MCLSSPGNWKYLGVNSLGDNHALGKGTGEGWREQACTTKRQTKFWKGVERADGADQLRWRRQDLSLIAGVCKKKKQKTAWSRILYYSLGWFTRCTSMLGAVRSHGSRACVFVCLVSLMLLCCSLDIIIRVAPGAWLQWTKQRWKSHWEVFVAEWIKYGSVNQKDRGIVPCLEHIRIYLFLRYASFISFCFVVL